MLTTGENLRHISGGVKADDRAANFPMQHGLTSRMAPFSVHSVSGEDLRHISGGVKADDRAAGSPVQRAVEAYFQFIKEVSTGDPAMQLAFWKVPPALLLIFYMMVCYLSWPVVSSSSRRCPRGTPPCSWSSGR